MKPFYSQEIQEFCQESVDNIVGTLTNAYAHAGYKNLVSDQIDSWKQIILILKPVCQKLISPIFPPIRIVMEYPIPRRGKRIDVVFVIGKLVLVLEFKVGSRQYTRQDIIQTEDYALDLRDFHITSRDRIVIPILISTEAKKDFLSDGCINKNSNLVVLTNKENLFSVIEEQIHKHSTYCKSNIDWESGNYQPIPTIIQAAQDLYSGHNVDEISRSHAGVYNLTRTTHAALNAIKFARENNQNAICFITGVPGAGKTLAGLNIIHNHDLNNSSLGTFLSGNRPLVEVLREALARDEFKRTSIKLHEARRKAGTFIQNVHHFLDAYYNNADIPNDKVIVFDEAQRAWDKKQSLQKFHRECSEPEMMLRIMNRQPDFSVIIALIGGGQEINRGEAGLREWGQTLLENYPNWVVYISPELKDGDHSTAGSTLFEKCPSTIKIVEDPDLHLSVSIRSYRAEQLSAYLSQLLALDSILASKTLADFLQTYPIYLTRCLETAKLWLKQKQAGTRRTGIIAASGARRLKAYGIDVTKDLDVCSWFLNPRWDVRSSDYLEDVATEFGIQGLELDWTCVCWDADLRHASNGWICKKFNGTQWQNVKDLRTQQYIINKYRVLLTRAREGMIIWIPKGDALDYTRLPEFYDPTAHYLKSCGIPEI